MAETGKKTLILGGARSGKSRHAEVLASAIEGSPVYIATARPGDAEMAARIATHRERRGEEWTTIEEALHLPAALEQASHPDSIILVDCLTLWLSNLLLAERDCEAAIANLIDVLEDCPGQIILVSNEVGLGIVPENELARRFRDIAGIANQRVAEICDEVVLVTAGLPLVLKPAR